MNSYILGATIGIIFTIGLFIGLGIHPDNIIKECENSINDYEAYQEIYFNEELMQETSFDIRTMRFMIPIYNNYTKSFDTIYIITSIDKKQDVKGVENE